MPGRAFVRQLIDLTKELQRPWHRMRITHGQTFLQECNGVIPISKEHWESSDTLAFFTNATASIGLGAYFKGKWLQGRWQHSEAFHSSIALLELYPVVVAIMAWGPLLANHKVKFQ